MQTESLIHQKRQRQLEHNVDTQYGETDDGNALVVGVLCYGYVCSAWCRLRGRWLLVACNFSLHYVLLPFLLPTFVLCHVCCRSCCRSCCSCCHYNVPLPRLLLLLLSVAVENDARDIRRTFVCRVADRPHKPHAPTATRRLPNYRAQAPTTSHQVALSNDIRPPSAKYEQA